MNQHIEKLNKLKRNEFWKYFVEHKSDLKLILDNDSTIIVAKDDIDNAEYEEYSDCPNYLGNSYGICDLLDALDIEWEHC